MPIGRIVRFNEQRGFGFVRPDSESGEDTFVHVSLLTRAGISKPKVGMPIIYQAGERNGKVCVLDCEALKPWQIDTDSTDD